MGNIKLVLFGAGKIGRSFIGQVFSRGGYEVVFVDINNSLVKLLNDHQQYKVINKNNLGNEVIYVNKIRAMHLEDVEQIIEELSGASIAALSVGQQGLPSAIPLIAQSLVKRVRKYGEWPLDIIIAENMRNADQYISAELRRLLPEDYPFNKLVGLIETSIGKMVPIMTQKDLDEDPLQIFAEPYNSLIVAKNGFKNQIPDIADLAPKDNIKAWVDRKLFIHNLGHATVAYLGFRKNPLWMFIYEPLEDHEIFKLVRETMLQSANILMSLHPGEFTLAQLEEHIDDLLNRFRNRALGDTIFRVGCDLYRKLSREDRLSGPVHAALKLKKPYNLIMNVIKAAIMFRATDEHGKFHPADQKFFKEAELGFDHVIKNICGLQSPC